MSILEYMERNNFEQLSVYTDPAVGLKALVSIHDTTLGPAMGGVRIWPHPTEEAAIEDVLRLGRAMTYKSAAAGLHFGGGKGLIIADPHKDKTEALMRSYGRFVEALGGRYITTEDVGMTLLDLEWIARETSHVVGLPISMGGSGDTSKMTGFGVYQGMRACAREVWNSDSLSGSTVAVQGFGNTARALAEQLIANEQDVKLIVSDVYEGALDRAREFGAEIVGVDEIYGVECDVFAPCALGGVLNGGTIPQIKASVVCGSANNQLSDDDDAVALRERGILYAPDFIVNAGGVINVSCEVGMTYSEEAAAERTARIYGTMQDIIAASKSGGITTAQAANRLAEERIDSVRKVRKGYLE